MKNKLLAAAILLTSTAYHADARIGLQAYGNISPIKTTEDNVPGYQAYWSRSSTNQSTIGGGLRIFKSLKLLDIGIGVERGAFQTTIGRVMGMEDSKYGAPSLVGKKVYNRAEYLLPHVYANLRLSLTKRITGYAGITAGYAFTPKEGKTNYPAQHVAILYYGENATSSGTTSSLLDASSHSVVAGIQAGGAFKLTNSVGFTAEIAMRSAWYTGSGTWYSYREGNRGLLYNYYNLRTHYTTLYFPIAIGVYLKL
jgi:hypothetical protein